ncbi:hypothetical protein, partial [Salmonella sp. SAL4432]|uniref:hypothetical protein n=1 Tax=Salmonella sp. SAL4432 TaxID=3159887 RepID=UPI0039799D34
MTNITAPQNLIIATNTAGEPQWISFEGGKDSYNPFDEMENERRKNLRLNPYQGEEANNPF